jgi:hypothetical protein
MNLHLHLMLGPIVALIAGIRLSAPECTATAP